MSLVFQSLVIDKDFFCFLVYTGLDLFLNLILPITSYSEFLLYFLLEFILLLCLSDFRLSDSLEYFLCSVFLSAVLIKLQITVH